MYTFLQQPKKVLTLCIALATVFGMSSYGQYIETLPAINSPVTVNNTLSSSNVNTYWNMCENGQIQGAYYVGQTANPGYNAYYSSTNPNRHRRFLQSSNILVYNPGTFNANGNFSFFSNIIPNGTTVAATRIQSPNPFVTNLVGRQNVAAMYVFNGHYQTMNRGSANNNSPFLYRTSYGQTNPTQFGFNLSVANQPVQYYSCNRYYVARCGDGVIDNINKPGGANTDGKQGINTVNGFVNWFAAGGVPAEVCDDGANNGQPGFCNSTCSGITPLPNPVCTSISINPNPTFPNQATNIVCNATNATSYSISVTGPGNPFNYTLGSSVNYTPTLPGNYTVSCTAFGAQGTTPSTCQAQILTVTDNSPQCEAFTATPQLVSVGQPVTLFCDGNQYSNTYQILVQNQSNNLITSYNGSLPAPNNNVTNTWTPNAPGTYTANCSVSNNNTQVAQCPGQTIVVGQPSLWVNKVANQTGVAQGGNITFTITFGNSGNVAANNVTIQDVLPASLTYVSHNLQGITGGSSFNGQTIFGYSAGFSGLTLQPGQSGTMTITASYSAAACLQGILNYATIYNTDIQSNTTAPFDCIPPAPANIVLDKKQHITGNPTDATINVESGNVITYTITVTNTGGSIQTGIYLEDILPANTTYINSTISGIPGLTSSHANGVVSSNVFALAPGQTITRIITANIDTGNGSFLNTAYVRHVNGTTIAQDSVLAFGIGPALTLSKVIANQQTYYLPGDTIVYTITFSNQGSGAAYDVVIQDILAQAVTYVSSSINPVLGTFLQTTQGGSQVISYGSFTLNPGQTVTLTVTGIVNTNINNNTLNTAILQSSNHPTLTATADFISQPVPQIIKQQRTTGTFTSNQIIVNVGDTITYQVVVTNIGGSTANGVVISDTLPVGVTYTSSSISVPFTNTSNTLVNGQTVVSYQGITLTPGQSTTMTITAQVTSATPTSYTNVARVEFFNPYQTATSSVVAVRLPTASVLFNKTITTTQTVYNAGDIVSFNLTFVNNGPDTVTNISLQDIRPSCLQFTNWTSNPQLAQTNNTSPYSRSHPSLGAGQSITLNLNGTVINDPNCSGTHVNTGRVTYTVGGNQFTLERIASFEILVPEPAQCVNLSSNTSSLLFQPNQQNRTAQFTCTADQAANLQIDCGNGTSSQSVFGTSLVHTCTYTANQVPNTYTAQCFVNGASSTPNSCQRPITLTQGSFNICGNGIVEGYEQCDLPNGTLVTNFLDNGFTPTPSSIQNMGYTCQNCALVGGTTAYQPPMCFYTNTTISVQRGEILPFRWDLDKSVNTNLTAGNTCTQPNSIPVGTMMCTFSFYAPNELNPGSHIAQFTTPCFGDSWGNDIYFNFFKNTFADSNNALGRYQWTLPSNLNKYGEYKVRLDRVQYQYCNQNLQFIANPQIVDRVCEVNFAVTRPYLVQKSAFSNVPQTTTIDIADFYAMNGTTIKDMTDLSQIMVLNASTYAINPNTNLLLHDFVSKYKQLAVSIPSSEISNLFSSAGQVKVSKVPGQQIYIFEKQSANQGATRITLREMQNLTTSFTMIVDGMDLVVQGSITNANGMFLVKGGKISFQEPSTNACATRQVVNGVFITDQGFGINDPQLLINNAFGKPWCNEGGLTVRGVLVGQNINALVNQRRSHLNTWFQIQNPNNPAALRAERRNKIFDGAALLIEYNPALRNSMPPGMSEFTQVLDVYKQ